MTRAVDADFIRDVEHDTLLRFSVLDVNMFNNVPVAADDTTGFKTVREDGAVNSYSVMRECVRLLCLLPAPCYRQGNSPARQAHVHAKFHSYSYYRHGYAGGLFVFYRKADSAAHTPMQRQAQHIEKSSKSLKKIEIEGDDEIFLTCRSRSTA